MNSTVSRHFFAAAALAGFVALLVGDGALAILFMAGGLAALPLAFGGDVDAIARATRRHLHD